MTDHFVHDAKDFKPTKGNIEIKQAGFGGSGFGTANIMYNRSSINLTTHEITTTWGFSEGYKDKYDPNLQFNLNLRNEADQQLYQAFKDLEEIIIETAYDRRVVWGLFGSQREADQATLEDVRKKFIPIVRQNNPDFPPVFKASFVFKKDRDSGEVEMKTPCHNQDNVLFIPSEETIPRRARCTVDLQAKQIWIAPEGNFGLKFRIQKIKVAPPLETQAPTRCRFGQSENKPPPIQAADSDDLVGGSSQTCAFRQDSDSDSD